MEASGHQKDESLEQTASCGLSNVELWHSDDPLLRFINHSSIYG